MASINETKNRLPKEFIENIYEMFTPGVADNVLRGFSERRYTTIRVNTLKTNVREVMKYFKEINIKFERVLWYNDALIIKNATEKELQKLEIYKEGKIYLQSLPSMIPPLVLSPEPGEKVLDLTAAPGGKTTEMAALMEGRGKILANELDKLRCERLKYNVELQGAKIVEINCGRGEKIGLAHPEEFDKVLLDAPCSGEGRFSMLNVQSYKTWSTRAVQELSKLQKKLLKSAYQALKPGGTLVYSTCTLNKEENECILNWAIEELGLKLLDIDLEIREKLPGFNENLNKTVNKAIRILPNKNMEGFFLAKLQKNHKKIC